MRPKQYWSWSNVSERSTCLHYYFKPWVS